MRIRITRPVVIAGDGGLRSYAPGLVVDAADAVLAQIMRQQAGVALDEPEAPRKPRRARA